MPDRQTNSGNYRYGYNGMEMDNEVSGNGNSYTTEFRQYDPRLGRWKSLDPLMHQFPWMSPYVAFDNNPIYFIDPYGLSPGGPEGDPNATPSEPNQGYTCYDETTDMLLEYKGDGEWGNHTTGDAFTDKVHLNVRRYIYFENLGINQIDEVVVIGKSGSGNENPQEVVGGGDRGAVDNVLRKAQQFSDANVTGMTYQSPSTTTSIDDIKNGNGGIDCSLFIDEIFRQSGYRAPRDYKGSYSRDTEVGDKGEWGNGVALIMDGLPVVDFNNLQEGDLVTFRTSRDNHKGPDGAFDHIGIVKNVERMNGQVVGFTYYDSGGSNSTAKSKRAKDPNSTYKAGPRLSTYSSPTKYIKFTGAYRPAYVKTNANP